MAGPSSIEWTDATWNPVTGCTKVSAGCDHCYAEAIARRFAGTKAFPNGFAVTLHPERLGLPLSWREPRRVFVNSMSDLFHDQVPEEFIVQVFAVMAAARRHTFQILTKRHARMRSVLSAPDFPRRVFTEMHRQKWGWPAGVNPTWPGGMPLRNVWLGVSVEDQRWADIRVPVLLDTPAVVRFISAEPLLGPVDVSRWLYPWVNWVIAGGESGPGARPLHPDWVRSLRDQCQAAAVPFFFKQWGAYRYSDAGGPHRRVGKKTAGRVLDGRTWDEYPAGVAR